MNVHISNRGARLAMLGTQLDNETASLTRLARERAKLTREYAEVVGTVSVQTTRGVRELKTFKRNM